VNNEQKDSVDGAIQYWAVAFIDILGQREVMREIDFRKINRGRP